MKEEKKETEGRCLQDLLIIDYCESIERCS